jgi:hypothetical protein
MVKNQILLFLECLMQSRYQPLCLLFNKSLRLKKYPRSWKIAHVIPLFKNGDKSLPSNYRPVSLLSCVSKIFEKTVTASVSGENLEKSRCKMQLCKQLGIPIRRISGEKRIGTKILKSESLAWNLTLRKTRRDARKRE